MMVYEAVRAILKQKDKNQSWLAAELGYSSPAGVNQMLMRGNMNLNTLCTILDTLGYELTAQPKRTNGARPTGQVVIESSVKGLARLKRKVDKPTEDDA